MSAAAPKLRTVVYTPETIAAYGSLIQAGFAGNPNEMLVALRHLAMMVHCDLTGELRLAHTHSDGSRESAP